MPKWWAKSWKEKQGAVAWDWKCREFDMKSCWSSTIVSIIRCAVLDLKIKIDGHCVKRSDPILIMRRRKKNPISYSMLEWNVCRFSSFVIENTHSIHSVVKTSTINCKIYLQQITNNFVIVAAVRFFALFYVCKQSIPFFCYTKLAVLTLIANSFCNRIFFYKTSTSHRSSNAFTIYNVHILLLLHHFTIGQRHFLQLFDWSKLSL